ncbi:AraC family transcriptional regulator [Chitinophaga ginsengisoli]|uniref:AraC family transcriptional regulator n=1 Tax=Chitinophaga ginsengisoli TaxID=363837 RepID=A0A2P8G2K0_9BACT|nr:helix-turn-helix domain-containing protein [Chitinophaga ginsengisoli]PSL28202.1 AraC family transcriptional regulator [Chitinophaga ginsengisoli]
MSLIASLGEIERHPASIFVIHERCEKHIPAHIHSKGQLSYVDGGLAYIRLADRLLVIPSRHYCWVPAGVSHSMTITQSGTHLRSILFAPEGENKHEFFNRVGIYPINDLLIEMMRFTEQWQGHVLPDEERFVFLQSIRNILPQISVNYLPIALPYTDNKRMLEIMAYMEGNLADKHTLEGIGKRFGLSDRTLSRFFRRTLKMSFLQYLKLLRMVRALELIQQKQHTLSEIAYLTGYQSLASFSYTFYQITGMRPSEFAHLDYRP